MGRGGGEVPREGRYYTMRTVALLILLIAGLLAVGVFGWFAVQDWGALGAAYRGYRAVAASNPSMQALFAAHAQQDIHRTNLFAEGVWAMLGAILAGIGVHGLCVMPRERKGQNNMDGQDG